MKSVRTQALAILQVHCQCASDMTTHGSQSGCSHPKHHVLPATCNMELSISLLSTLSFIPPHPADFPYRCFEPEWTTHPGSNSQRDSGNEYLACLFPRCCLLAPGKKKKKVGEDSCALLVLLVFIFNYYFAVTMW